MIAPLHVLLAAPDPADDLLAALRRAGYDPRPEFATQPEALGNALARGKAKLLILRQGLPGLSPWDALARTEQQADRLPVIVVTEEDKVGGVVALLEAGVRDVVSISDLDRLGVAVAKALRWRRETPRVHASGEPSADAVFHDLAEQMPIGLYRTTEEGRILYANPAFARLLGCESADALLGETVSDTITYPREAFAETLRAEGRVENYEAWWERDGEEVCTRENTRAVLDDEGELLYYEGTIEDITEQQQALLALRDSEASLRTMADATGLVFYRRLAGSSDYDQVSPSVESLTGYTSEGLATQGGLDALAEQREVLDGDAQGDGSATTLYRIRTADGAARWVEDSAHPWTDEAGEVIGQAGVLRDVTEQHEREHRERTQNAQRLARQKVLTKLSALGGETDDVLQHVTAEVARETETGRASLWLLGDGELQCRDLYVRSEDAHRTDAPFRAESVAETFGLLSRQRVVETPDVLGKPADERYALDVYHARNGVHAVLLASVRRRDQVIGFVALEHLGESRAWTEDERDFAVAIADLVSLLVEQSGRGEAEAALQQSERRYRVISELASDFAYALRIDADGSTDIVWATAAFKRISGYDPDELDGYEGLVGLVHEDDRPAVEEALDSSERGKTVRFECRIRTKSGGERWVAHRSQRVYDETARCSYVYVSGRDVTQRKTFEADLVEARTEAERLVHQKSAFLASMSHEIRTPLTALLGFAGVLADEVDEENLEVVRLIETSGKRLMETLNSVLDLAHLESGNVEVSAEPLDVVEEMKQTVRLLAPLADKKGIDLRVEDSDSEVIAPLDATCLRRILNNLIGNAVKFTERGEVVVGASLFGPVARIWIRDTGIGIGSAFLPNVFDEFQQEAGGNTTGSGLGLAITKRLVELMDGTVSVESTKGQGSVFTLSFPVEFGEDQVQQAVEMTLAKGEGQQAEEPEDDRPRVLVVEDNAETRLLIERILGQRYRADVAGDVGMALGLLKDNAYDALVLDIHLSGEQTGVELLQAARLLPNHETVAALALTAYALPGDRERFLDSGFDAYLSKPFTKADLMASLVAIGVAVADA
ncbi:MAG: PAS domain S-box protein [Bacteroidota bacterium]